jgi:hypothetical protein
VNTVPLLNLGRGPTVLREKYRGLQRRIKNQAATVSGLNDSKAGRTDDFFFPRKEHVLRYGLMTKGLWRTEDYFQFPIEPLRVHFGFPKPPSNISREPSMHKEGCTSKLQRSRAKPRLPDITYPVKIGRFKVLPFEPKRKESGAALCQILCASFRHKNWIEAATV